MTVQFKIVWFYTVSHLKRKYWILELINLLIGDSKIVINCFIFKVKFEGFVVVFDCFFNRSLVKGIQSKVKVFLWTLLCLNVNIFIKYFFSLQYDLFGIFLLCLKTDILDVSLFSLSLKIFFFLVLRISWCNIEHDSFHPFCFKCKLFYKFPSQ
jgi:hypothetical protein